MLQASYACLFFEVALNDNFGASISRLGERHPGLLTRQIQSSGMTSQMVLQSTSSGKERRRGGVVCFWTKWACCSLSQLHTGHKGIDRSLNSTFRSATLFCPFVSAPKLMENSNPVTYLVTQMEGSQGLVQGVFKAREVVVLHSVAAASC